MEDELNLLPVPDMSGLGTFDVSYPIRTLAREERIQSADLNV